MKSSTVSKIVSRIGLVVLVGLLFLLLFLAGFALQASGFGWLALAGIVALLGYALYRTLK